MLCVYSSVLCGYESTSSCGTLGFVLRIRDFPWGYYIKNAWKYIWKYHKNTNYLLIGDDRTWKAYDDLMG